MEPLQILLIIIGIGLAAGGIYMLFRMAGTDKGAARGPYTPLAIAFIGLMIAYRSYSDYKTLDTMDFVIMFLFVFALVSLLGIQFFIVDRHK